MKTTALATTTGKLALLTTSVEEHELYDASFDAGALGRAIRGYIAKNYLFAFSTASNNPAGNVYHVIGEFGRPVCGWLASTWRVRGSVILVNEIPEDRRRCRVCIGRTCTEF